MTNELIGTLKKAMGYTETQSTCDICIHYTEEEDPMLDRSWTSLCKFNSITPIEVNKKASCDFFKRKQV